MARILVTGMSGAGKTTLLEELARRGYQTLDTDYGGWELPSGLWDEARMTAFLATHDDVVVSGTVDNQGRFYDRFHHIVLLSAPVDVLLDRVRNRTNNPYGHAEDEQEEIRRYVEEVEPLLQRGATVEFDGRRSVEELADAVEKLMGKGWSPDSLPTVSAGGDAGTGDWQPPDDPPSRTRGTDQGDRDDVR